MREGRSVPPQRKQRHGTQLRHRITEHSRSRPNQVRTNLYTRVITSGLGFKTFLSVACFFFYFAVIYFITNVYNGLFTLTETDSGTESDSDSKPDGYMYYAEHVHIAQT